MKRGRGAVRRWRVQFLRHNPAHQPRGGQRQHHVYCAFSPSGTGAATATVTIANDDATNGSYTFNIQGTGTNAPTAEISISGNGQPIANGDNTPSTADGTAFGKKKVSAGSASKTFTISNTGSSNLGLISVELVGGDAPDFILHNPSSLTIAAGSSTTFSVAFDPATTGTKSTTVSIASNDSTYPTFTFAVSGKGTQPSLSLSYNGTPVQNGDVAPSAAKGTDFGRISVNNASHRTTFTIVNSGDADLVLSAIHITGSNANQFSAANPASLTVAAGGSATFSVTYNPSAAGAHAAQVSIDSDYPNGAYSFQVKGTGLSDQNFITSYQFRAFNPVVNGSIAGTQIKLAVPHGTPVKALVATYQTSGVSVKVGSKVQASGSTANDFTNPVRYTVTAQDGSTRTYTVTVTQLPAQDAALSSVNFGAANITGMTTEKVSYTVDVPYGTDPATLHPTAIPRDPDAHCGAWSYNSATKTWSVQVTAEDGVTRKLYTFVIHVLADTSTTMQDTVINQSGTNADSAPSGGIHLSQTETGYVATVDYTCDVLAFKHGKANNTTIIVNGQAVPASEKLDFGLVVGMNHIVVDVLSADGSRTRFDLRITRRAQGKGLWDLDVLTGYLRPAISDNRTAYEAGIPNTSSSFRVLVRAYDTKATVTINGQKVSPNGGTSNAIAITVAKPVKVKIVVTDRDGKTKVYIVTAIRSRYLSDNNCINSLTVSSGSLSPAFSKTGSNYTVNVAAGVNSIRVKPGSAFLAAKIRVNGVSVWQGTWSPAIKLNPGRNTIKVTVTAENGAVRTYTITVIRPS